MWILLLNGSQLSSVFGQLNVITDPCTGRNGGHAIDLRSCSHFFECRQGRGIRGQCRNNMLYDAELNQCVARERARCFSCRHMGFEQFSVPNVCNQYIICFGGRPTLHICPPELVYDGRLHVAQCNEPPRNGGCFRENHSRNNSEPRCPQGIRHPVFLRDTNDCST